MCMLLLFCIKFSGDTRDVNVLALSFPPRRSSFLSSRADAGRVHRERDGAERTRHGSEFGRPDIGAAAGNLHIAREALPKPRVDPRSEEHTSEIQSLMRITYAVFCLK